MLNVTSSTLELRGVQSKTTSKGKAYYILNVEDESGSPYALYCPEFNTLPRGLDKGDKIAVTFEVKVYNGNERLIVIGVDKVEE